jgi:hypothetical protein
METIYDTICMRRCVVKKVAASHSLFSLVEEVVQVKVARCWVMSWEDISAHSHPAFLLDEKEAIGHSPPACYASERCISPPEYEHPHTRKLTFLADLMVRSVDKAENMVMPKYGV